MKLKWLLGLLAAGAVSAHAGLDKLEAIAMIESGNDDRAVGSAGEISRYQIKPRIWQRYSASSAYHNAQVSAGVADRYLAALEDTFQRQSGRAPTDFDRYVLWNAGPSYYGRIRFDRARVHPVVRERAERFVNLRERKGR